MSSLRCVARSPLVFQLHHSLGEGRGIGRGRSSCHRCCATTWLRRHLVRILVGVVEAPTGSAHYPDGHSACRCHVRQRQRRHRHMQRLYKRVVARTLLGLCCVFFRCAAQYALPRAQRRRAEVFLLILIRYEVGRCKLDPGFNKGSTYL